MERANDIKKVIDRTPCLKGNTDDYELMERDDNFEAISSTLA